MTRAGTSCAALAAVVIACLPARAEQAKPDGRVGDIAAVLRQQIAQCWSPPAGASGGVAPVVTFDLSLNLDGSVARPPQLAATSSSRAANDPLARMAEAAALRAILTCAPYKLPADKYDIWRDSTLDFDPPDGPVTGEQE